MSVLGSLRRGLRAVVDNPSMFVPALALALLGVPQLAFLVTGRTLLSNGYQLVTLLVAPLFLAGTVGMAHEALRAGRTSLGRFGSAARETYLTVLLAQIGQFVVLFGVVVAGLIATFVVTAVVGVGVVGLASGASDGLGSAFGAGFLLLVGGSYLLFLLVVALVVFFLQFYGVAAVVEGTNAIGSLRRSARFVRSNLLRTLGYSLLLFVVGLLNFVPTIGLLLLGGGVDPGTGAPGAGATTSRFDVDTTTALALGAYSVIGTTVLYPVQQAFATAFFVDHRDTDGSGSDPSADGTPSAGVDEGSITGTD